jgi:nucleotide-binding universal stress UspA family protein
VYQRILVALDGSEISEQVIPYVEQLAEKFNPVVTIVRVIPSLTRGSSESAELSPVQQTEVQAAQAQLERISTQLRKTGCTVQTAMPFGRPADEIVDLARSSSADLIALTTHGRGLGRLLFGSVSTEVLRKAHCPVLMIPVREDVERGGSQDS